jgi:Uma2 family endonuclease
MNATGISTSRQPVPRLESGDHLDQRTFHARYAAMPGGFRAELIGGFVVVPSPLSTEHGEYHALVMYWLGEYRLHTPGVSVRDNATVILGPNSEAQPDAALVIDPKHGGRSRVDESGYTVGPPELIVEIASSSHAYDLHEKLRDYETAGVLEYAVVLLREREIRWFVLEQGEFRRRAAEGGVFDCRVFPGLRLDGRAILALDHAAVIESLHMALGGAEHQAFVERLTRS